MYLVVDFILDVASGVLNLALSVLRELLQNLHQPSSGVVVMEDLAGEFLVGADGVRDAASN